MTVGCNTSLRTPSDVSLVLLFEDPWILQEEGDCGAALLQRVQAAAIAVIFSMVSAAIPCTVCT